MTTTSLHSPLYSNMDLNILQWNAQGLYNKTTQLIEALITGNIHVALIQETICGENVALKIPGYQHHKIPWSETSQGMITLVKTNIPHTRITQPVDCGEGTEQIGIQLELGETSIQIYNIYHRPQRGSLDIAELFAEAEQHPMIIGGDFNAHHTCLQSPGRVNRAGQHLYHVMQDTQTTQLLNDLAEPTHLAGGRLDLIFTSNTLATNTHWKIHHHLASDHYAIISSIPINYSIYEPPQITRWNVKKANWALFDHEITQWWEETGQQMEGTLDEQETQLLNALNNAASIAIPKKKNGQYHRDWWFFNEKIREMNARVNQHRKTFRRHRSQENARRLREVIAHSRIVSNQARIDQWYEWCASFDQHTSLSELWRKLKTATGQYKKKTPAHPHPKREAERLMTEFASRASDEQLPPEIRTEQQRRKQRREEAIQAACSLADITDTPFTPQELQQAQKRSTDTAPGRDGITYSIINHAGNVGLQAILALFNHSWRRGKLPAAWKEADITPIPKPNEENKYRPIALTSCLCKHMERMVKERLEWKLGQLHTNIFGFSSGRGTTDCIMELLSHIRDKKAIVVFLDIEKAFELANPLAILEILAKKGVRGHMLSWIRDYLANRKARVIFQGHPSSDHQLPNGTPQGGVISPLLFNLLMEEIVGMKLPRLSCILSYADDLALVVKGAKPLNRAQTSLDLISSKCKILGLKLSNAKSKAMMVKGRTPDTHLTIQESELQWVKSYLYLGVWIDQALTFNQELKHIKEKTNHRLKTLKAMTNPKTGASMDIIRLFYMQAIRTHIDYAAPFLVALADTKWRLLEPIQNKAMRIMTGSPPWTPGSSLLIETGLVPLKSRIQERTACVAANTLQRGGNSQVKKLIIRNMPCNHPTTRRKKWEHEFTRTMKMTINNEIMTARTQDHPDPNHQLRPPWKARDWEIVIRPPRLSKNDITDMELQQHGRETIALVAPQGSAIYYTDGSVEQEEGRAGAAFVTLGSAYGWRVSTNASSMQTELAAIIQASRHASTREENIVVIFTDSLSALQAIQHDKPKDNIRLTTTAISHLDNLQQQGKHVKLAWIPSHVGIKGNERADQAAKQVAAREGERQDIFKIPPSLMMTRRRIKVLTQEKAAEETANNCNEWFRIATNLQPLVLGRNTSREDRVNLLRLRLGYKTTGEIIQNLETTTCELCGSEAEDQLVHYLLHCSQTQNLRTQIRPPQGQGRAAAAQYVCKLLNYQHNIATFMREYPPPR